MYPNKHRRGPGGRIIFFPIIAAAIALGLGAIVRLLWNAILPEVTHASRITYWQAVGLLILCRILVGGFGRGGMRGKGPMGGRGAAWREKWMGMTPEDREKLQREWRDRCRPKASRSTQENKPPDTI